MKWSVDDLAGGVWDGGLRLGGCRELNNVYITISSLGGCTYCNYKRGSLADCSHGSVMFWL